ncbi:MAG: methyltransferase domain-containing protein [Phycisphaeraceae bacterium]
MHGLNPHDQGRVLDWGRTSDDYAEYRPGYPDSFFQRLRVLGVGLPGQTILDVGAGTGVLARVFAGQGSEVTATDVSAEQIEACQRLAREQGVSVRAFAAPAERTELPDASFDVITASQAWLYFDCAKMIPQVKRMLKPGGRLMTCHLCWLPRVDAIARATEALVLKHNPAWSAANWSGSIPAQPAWSIQDFTVTAMFYYDVAMPFTIASWLGRIRACRGIGALLSPEQVEAFDRDHAAMLRERAGESFTITHRIDAHLFALKE